MELGKDSFGEMKIAQSQGGLSFVLNLHRLLQATPLSSAAVNSAPLKYHKLISRWSNTSYASLEHFDFEEWPLKGWFEYTGMGASPSQLPPHIFLEAKPQPTATIN